MPYKIQGSKLQTWLGKVNIYEKENSFTWWLYKAQNRKTNMSFNSKKNYKT